MGFDERGNPRVSFGDSLKDWTASMREMRKVVEQNTTPAGFVRKTIKMRGVVVGIVVPTDLTAAELQQLHAVLDDIAAKQQATP
jgi:hypothetical protein